MQHPKSVAFNLRQPVPGLFTMLRIIIFHNENTDFTHKNTGSEAVETTSEPDIYLISRSVAFTLEILRI